MDLATIVGLLLAIGGILGGQVLEGGHVSSIMQGTAAIIVLGGTIGAVMIGSTMEDLKTAMKLVKLAFFDDKTAGPEKIVEEIVEAAQIARKGTILALEKKLPEFSHPYMQSVFKFVIDGVESKTIQELFENEIMMEEAHLGAGAKVFVDAGGFAPTIGIIGAVLGLIHVMENLADTSKLGSGIAVAFVATVYGVGIANILFLPMGNKMKRKIKNRSHIKEMVLVGALSIAAGLNPVIIEEKLKYYLHNKDHK